MFGAKKTGILAVAGLAALAYYKYNKMSAEEKQQLSGKLKEQCNRFMEMMPGGLKSIFSTPDKGSSSATS